MKRADIDQIFDIMAAEAKEKGDDAFLPGEVTFNANTWIARKHSDLPTTCTSIGVGIRYRGVMVSISSQFEDKVMNRAEAGARGEPFLDLEPRA